MKGRLSYKNEIILYGVATGVNRGGLLLILPFLTATIGLEAFGEYSLVQVGMQLLAPIFSFNIQAAILREGVLDYNKGVAIYNNYFKKILTIYLPFIILSFFICYYLEFTYLYAFMFLAGCTEGIHNMQLALIRIKDNHKGYFVFTFIKTIGFILLCILLSRIYIITLHTVLTVQAVLNISLLVIYNYSYRLDLISTSLDRPFLKKIFNFSILLIPHSLAQWLISASNRPIVKYLDTKYNLGIISIAFSLALTGMIINSGVGIVLPQQILREYKSWISIKRFREFGLLYSLVFLLMLNLVLLGLIYDKYYTHFIKVYDKNLITQFVLIFSGYYLLGYYYYYSNLLFYHRKAQLVSIITLVTSIFSVLLTFILTLHFSVLGTALSVLISYFFYSFMMGVNTLKVEKNVKQGFIEGLIIQIASITLFYLNGIIYSEIIATT